MFEEERNLDAQGENESILGPDYAIKNYLYILGPDYANKNYLYILGQDYANKKLFIYP